MGDHVVQLARDPRPLLDDRLARRDVALALGQLRAPLAVADDAPRDRGARQGEMAAEEGGRSGARPGVVARLHERDDVAAIPSANFLVCDQTANPYNSQNHANAKLSTGGSPQKGQP